MPDTPKFLWPLGSTTSHISPRVYNFPLGHPIIITERPIEALACDQAGRAGVGLNGVWGARVTTASGEVKIRADLYAALDSRGRLRPTRQRNSGE
jgi:hypothetical protein